jgi:hypothetical protein
MHPYMIELLIRVCGEELDRTADAWRAAHPEGSRQVHPGAGLGHGRARRGVDREPGQVGPVVAPDRVEEAIDAGHEDAAFPGDVLHGCDPVVAGRQGRR